MIDFIKFLEDGITSQQEYAEKSGLGLVGPLDFMPASVRYKIMVEMIGHIIEEAVETRMLIPRRPWKRNEEAFDDSEEGAKEFCKEVTDILLFIRGLMAYSGISPQFFEAAFNEKLHYNKVREDHK